MDKSDEQLILEYQQGAQKAMEVIFLRYQKPIFNFALRLIGNRADAQDVSAEVFMILVEKSSCYTPEPRAKFSTWLYTVARNSCLSKLRRRKISFSFFQRPTSIEQDPLPIEVPDHKTPATALHNKELAQGIRQAVEQLPLPQREAFILREFQDLSYEEIVLVTGNSLANVKILIFRAREALRQNLGYLLEELPS